jgi:signal transduction histidine kinase
VKIANIFNILVRKRTYAIDIDKLEKNIRRDFQSAMTVIGLSSVWVFVYLVVGKGGGFKILKGTGSLVMLINMTLLLLGIIISRRMLWSVIEELIFFNKETARLQGELIEKDKLATIAKTTLTLSHEINNPLMVIRGNVEVLKEDLSGPELKLSLEDIRKRVQKIADQAERISVVIDTLLTLSRPAEATVHGDIKMIDPKRRE